MHIMSPSSVPLAESSSAPMSLWFVSFFKKTNNHYHLLLVFITMQTI